MLGAGGEHLAAAVIADLDILQNDHATRAPGSPGLLQPARSAA